MRFLQCGDGLIADLGRSFYLLTQPRERLTTPCLQSIGTHRTLTTLPLVVRFQPNLIPGHSCSHVDGSTSFRIPDAETPRCFQAVCWSILLPYPEKTRWPDWRPAGSE